MREAIFTLIGVLIGSAIPSAAAVYTSWRHRQDTRVGRLFDDRRDAYWAFVEAARGLLRTTWEYHEGERLPPGGEDLEPLLTRESAVIMFGTPEATDLAITVHQRLVHYITGDGPFEGAAEAIANFTATARRDLGVAD